VLKAERLTKNYDTPAGPLPILEGIDFALSRGESAAIMGPSGSGKSTLLYLLGALDRPTSGSVIVNDTEVGALNEAKQAEFRNRHIGFVFQDHALLPQCTILENVLIPTLVADGAAKHTERARGLVEAVGLSSRIDHKPGQLSGGERQRVAIARALIMEPAVLLCDEPTGNLDRTSAATVADLLLRLHREANSVLVVVTHNPELAERFPARFELRDRALHRLA
jgi:lipoprotein-releasing system ATP-binding protein